MFPFNKDRKQFPQTGKRSRQGLNKYGNTACLKKCCNHTNMGGQSQQQYPSTEYTVRHLCKTLV